MICRMFFSYYIIFSKSWREAKVVIQKPHRYIQFLPQCYIILQKHHFPVNLSLTLFFVLSTRPVNSSYPLTVILAQYYQINGKNIKRNTSEFFVIWTTATDSVWASKQTEEKTKQKRGEEETHKKKRNKIRDQIAQKVWTASLKN